MDVLVVAQGKLGLVKRETSESGAVLPSSCLGQDTVHLRSNPDPPHKSAQISLDAIMLIEISL